MADQGSILRRLRAFNSAIRGADAEIHEESLDVESVVAESTEELRQNGSAEAAIELESIVLRTTRPVLAIRDNSAVLEFEDASDSRIWRQRLQDAAPVLKTAIQAIGRVNLEGAGLEWVGTGWLVAEDILVTNRHVAEVFVMRGSQGLTFKSGVSGPISSSIDFLQEIGSSRALVFRLLRPLHVVADPGPDVAFFEIEQIAGDRRLARPIALASRIDLSEDVATIGYPARDSRIPDIELMEKIYGGVYNKKRLAPGAVTRIEETRLQHNCTTLGGNSGSAVIDFRTGEALGLHFSGSFLVTNFAVRADVVRRLRDGL